MKNLPFVFIFFTLILSACNASEDGKNDRKNRNKFPEEGRKDIPTQIFESAEFNFSLSYPESWKKDIFNTGNDKFVFNVYHDLQVEKSPDLPIIVHAGPEISFVAVYPEGFGTELPMGDSRKLKSGDINLNFEPDTENSEVFMLENGEAWGYFIVPSSPPESWDIHGFIFAQARIRDYRAVCIDGETGEEIDMAQCDPMTGDTIKKFGTVDKEQQEHLELILSSIEFTKSVGENEKATGNDQTGDIRIEQPAEGSAVSSPLTVKGKARGSWYFEGNFNIRLVKNERTLAETIAVAQSEWTTQDFVPFEGTLEFSGLEPGEEAQLIFSNSNPSGLPENEKSRTIMVVGK